MDTVKDEVKGYVRMSQGQEKGEKEGRKVLRSS